MVNYVCLRCGYENRIKSIFINHLNRKFICKPKIKNVESIDIYNFYFKNEKNMQKTCTKNHQNSTEKIDVRDNEKQITQNISTKNHQYWCKFCDKIFKHKRSLNRHESFRCKEAKNKQTTNDDFNTMYKNIKYYLENCNTSQFSKIMKLVNEHKNKIKNDIL